MVLTVSLGPLLFSVICRDLWPVLLAFPILARTRNFDVFIQHLLTKLIELLLDKFDPFRNGKSAVMIVVLSERNDSNMSERGVLNGVKLVQLLFKFIIIADRALSSIEIHCN